MSDGRPATSDDVDTLSELTEEPTEQPEQQPEQMRLHSPLIS
jgi:hypothetical protein